MLFDSHAHLNLAAFDFDRDELIKRYQKESIFLVNVGTCLETSEKAVEIAGQYKNCWASVGLHPTHTFSTKTDPMEISSKIKSPTRLASRLETGGQKSKIKITNQNSKFIEPEILGENYVKLLNNPKVVAIGECGLDYSYLKDFSEKDQAKYKKIEEREFRKQIQVAKQHQLPLILHVRDIYQKAISILEEENFDFKAVFHFFSGDLESLRLILKKPNFYLGFSGIITYSKKMDEIIKNTPWERILIETDAPYAAPVPYRGVRNEPKYVLEVAKKIAEIKNLPFEEVEKQTFQNALRFFNINLN